jgi:hypothetical protein
MEDRLCREGSFEGRTSRELLVVVKIICTIASWEGCLEWSYVYRCLGIYILTWGVKIIQYYQGNK